MSCTGKEKNNSENKTDSLSSESLMYSGREEHIESLPSQCIRYKFMWHRAWAFDPA